MHTDRTVLKIALLIGTAAILSVAAGCNKEDHTGTRVVTAEELKAQNDAERRRYHEEIFSKDRIFDNLEESATTEAGEPSTKVYETVKLELRKEGTYKLTTKYKDFPAAVYEGKFERVEDSDEIMTDIRLDDLGTGNILSRTSDGSHCVMLYFKDDGLSRATVCERPEQD